VVLLAVLALLPGLSEVSAFHRQPSLGSGHDGGVAVTDRAVGALLAGRDPYTEPYADVVSRMPIAFGDREIPNPVMDRYPYWPATLLAQPPVQAPLRWAGVPVVDARYTYLGVLAALGAALARWSLRARGDLLLGAAVVLNPILLAFTRWGTNDVLPMAGLALRGWALSRRRTVLAGLGLGLALACKLLAAPAAALFLVWLARRVADRELGRRAAVGAGAATVLPALVSAAPFLLWHPAAFLDDAVRYHLGAGRNPFPVAGQGLPALLYALRVAHTRSARCRCGPPRSRPWPPWRSAPAGCGAPAGGTAGRRGVPTPLG